MKVIILLDIKDQPVCANSTKSQKHIMDPFSQTQIIERKRVSKIYLMNRNIRKLGEGGIALAASEIKCKQTQVNHLHSSRPESESYHKTS